MTPEQWFGLALAIAGVIGASGTLGGVIVSRRSGVSSHELQARRDTVADRDALIDQLQEEVRSLRDEISPMRTRLERLERAHEEERAYNDRLVAHIYEGKGPPPPQRSA